VLAGRLAARRRRQDESRAAVTLDWDGTWEMAVVPDAARDAATRAELRRAARALRFAELRDGVWLRPANLRPDRQPEERRVVAEQCQLFDSAAPTSTSEARALAASLWSLHGWADDAEQLCNELRAAGPGLSDAGPEDLTRAFVLEADVLRHLQHDPLLPDTLLPARWPAARLRQALDRFHPRFDDRWRTWIRNTR
jgi:phenylacetic acid degradation operon negative regulatory protein